MQMVNQWDCDGPSDDYSKWLLEVVCYAKKWFRKSRGVRLHTPQLEHLDASIGPRARCSRAASQRDLKVRDGPPRSFTCSRKRTLRYPRHLGHEHGRRAAWPPWDPCATPRVWRMPCAAPAPHVIGEITPEPGHAIMSNQSLTLSFVLIPTGA